MTTHSTLEALVRRRAWGIALAVAMGLAASCANTGTSHEAPADTFGDQEGGASSGGSFGSGSSSGAFTGGLSPDGGNSTCNSTNKCDDFPASPILDPLASPSGNPASLFGNPSASASAAGPCLVEPADGALYPRNWLRPRVYWTATSDQTTFEVRVHSDFETHDLVVYTTNRYYALDEGIWESIAKGGTTDAGAATGGNLVGTGLTFTVRSIGSGGGTPAASSTSKILIAPAIADGSLVYWTTSNFDNNASNTTLQGFHVGDEATTTALTSGQVAQTVRAEPVDGGNLTTAFQPVFCIGCHSATPDGQYVSFVAQWPWPIALASISSGSTGAKPSWLSNGAIQNLSPDMKDPYTTYYAPPAVNQVMMGISTFSPAHYAQGDRVLISSVGASWNSTSLTDPGSATGVVSQLAWFDLEWNNSVTTAGGTVDAGLVAATPCNPANGAQQPCIASPTSNGGWGIIQRNGDTRSAGSPSWSHDVDGQTDFIAYSSSDVGTKDGRMDCSSTPNCVSDVYYVPYGGKAGTAGGPGGAAKPLSGAADSAYNEYYPAWSPDDKLIAFNRVPSGTGMYDQPKAEVYVVPFSGGQGGTPVGVTDPFPPPACSNPYSGGVENTWPKWAPNPVDGDGKEVAQVDADGNTYYWITFSSIRSPLAEINANGRPKQQLYVAGVIVDKQGNVHSYAPIYLWNQSYQVNNLIPAWGEFSLPAADEPPPPPPAPK